MGLCSTTGRREPANPTVMFESQHLMQRPPLGKDTGVHVT
jgi:hypothetical protein